jgi:predicted MFS family arabinose efflux permease
LNALSYPLLLLLVFIGGILDTPGGTARQSLLPDLIARAQIRPEQANAAYDAVFRFAILTGPLLGGFLVASFSATDVLWIDAATFAISALLIALYAPRGVPRPTAPHEKFSDNFSAGFRFLKDDHLLMAILITLSLVDLLANALLVAAVPVYAERVFGSAVDFGAMLSVFGGGMLAGTVLYGIYGHRLPRYRLMIAGLLISGTPPLLLIALPGLPVALPVLALMGFGLGPVSTLSLTVFQERTPAHLRGRVFAARLSVTLASIPFGTLITGALIEWVGLQPTIAALTIGYFSIGLIALLLPAMRQLRLPSSGLPSLPQT